MKKLFLSLFFCLSVCSVKADTDVYFFSVGQANFMLAKKENSAIVLDCGTKIRSSRRNTHNEMKNKVKDILGGIRPVIFISHQDSDHYNGIDEFFPKEKRSMVVVGGGCPSEKIADVFTKDDVKFIETVAGGKVFNFEKTEENGKKSEDVINDAKNLMRDIDIECLLPLNPVTKDNTNNQSLILLLKDSSRKVLFTGDCTAESFAELLSDPGGQERKEKLQNCDVLILPHHGSNNHGELMCHYVLNPKLCIVSSNPKGPDGIPKKIVSNLYFSSTVPTKKHKFSFADSEKNSIETEKPLFLTSDANSCFYKLKIEKGGSITLTDGDESEVYKCPPALMPTSE